MKTQSRRSASGASAGAGVVVLLDRRALAGQRRPRSSTAVRLDQRARRPPPRRPPRAPADRPGRTAAAAIRHLLAVAQTRARGAVIERSAAARSPRGAPEEADQRVHDHDRAIAIASATSPSAAETAAAASSSQMSGLASCRRAAASATDAAPAGSRWRRPRPGGAPPPRSRGRTALAPRVGSRRDSARILRRGGRIPRPRDTDRGLSPPPTAPAPPPAAHPGGRRTSRAARRSAPWHPATSAGQVDVGRDRVPPCSMRG